MTTGPWVCVDGMGTILRWSMSATPPGIRDLQRALRARPMPELVSPPTVRGPRGHAFGGAPAIAAAAGSLLVAGLVLLGMAPGDQLGSPGVEVSIGYSGAMPVTTSARTAPHQEDVVRHDSPSIVAATETPSRRTFIFGASAG